MNEQDILSHQIQQQGWLAERKDAAMQEEHWENMRPSTIYKPTLSIDGNMWCALYGSNPQDGVCGFGVSPHEAYADFDKAWYRVLEKIKS